MSSPSVVLAPTPGADADRDLEAAEEHSQLVRRAHDALDADLSAATDFLAQHAAKPAPAHLAYLTLGIVYGDIGTSPLYVFSSIFAGQPPPQSEQVLGSLSLMIWTLLVVVAVKYVGFVLLADDNGEGGTFAIYSLVARGLKRRYAADPKLYERIDHVLANVALVGLAALCSEGILTPSISVLSAVEGFAIASPVLEPLVVPLAVAILVAFFSMQQLGTSSIAFLFSPVILLWLLSLFVIGVWNVSRMPVVLGAFNPLLGLQYLSTTGLQAWGLMGSVFLTVTGSEAMFGDLGHFNALAIRMSALGIVLPALLACYCGQAAAIIQDPTIVSNTFYRSLPSPLLLFPMVVLSTMAAIIASQSMVSASFSLISQAIGKNCFPRMTVRRTDRFQFGAVYVPEVNYFYMVSCVFIVCLFRSSSALGDAYGVAVSTLFCITTFFYSLAIVHHFDKGVGPALLFLCAFGAFDVGFFLANLSKIQDGGWFTVLLSFWFSACAITYRWGRKRMLEQQLGMSRPNAELFLGDLPPPKSAKPLMICMSSLPDAIPASFVHFFHRAHTRPQYLVFLTVHVSTTEAVMRDPAGELALAPVHGHDNVFRANVRCGFLDADLDIKPLATRLIRKLHCIDLPDAASDDDVLAACDPTFLLGRDSVVPLPGSSRWHVWAVFAFSLLLGTSRSRIFSWKMPPEEVLECCLYVGI